MSDLHNVFLDLGRSDEDATIEAWRSDLIRIIRGAWQASGKPKAKFAREIGMDQPTFSRIANGRMASISIERLVKICVQLKTRGSAEWGPSANDAIVRTDGASPLTTTIRLAVNHRAAGISAAGIGGGTHANA